jgi:hypothetical protein
VVSSDLCTSFKGIQGVRGRCDMSRPSHTAVYINGRIIVSLFKGYDVSVAHHYCLAKPYGFVELDRSCVTCVAVIKTYRGVCIGEGAKGCAVLPKPNESSEVSRPHSFTLV